jgi:Ca2+-binding RTX toxin-like protein
VQWSYKSDGLLQVWRDGQKVLDRAGPNTYNDLQGNYFKFGIYNHSIESPTDKTLYFDEVRLGNQNNTYEDVAPNGIPPSPPPPSPPPPPPVGNTLTVNGGAGNDTISISQTETKIIAVINGVTNDFNRDGITKLVVNGNSGNDTILLDASVTLKTTLNGGAGRDHLRGGSGANEFIGGTDVDFVDYSDASAGVTVTLENVANDGPNAVDNVHGDVENVIGSAFADTLIGNGSSNLFVGNGGADTLKGGSNRDVLIGGDNADKLWGESGEDLLIGGRTSYDSTPASLITLQSAWVDSTRGYATRISRLRAGTPGVGINAGSIVDDTAADQLIGGSDIDWFIKQPLDTLTDRSMSETVDSI